MLNCNIKIDMKPIFKCKIYFFPSLHLSQIYDGFEKLRQKGVVELDILKSKGDITKPILTTIINGKKVLFDTLDGLNWIEGTIDDNLSYFRENYKADYYFKRSYNEKVLENSPDQTKILPLGLNYGFNFEGQYPIGIIDKTYSLIRNNYFVKKRKGKSTFKSKEFEFYPLHNKENKILLLTRLWDPNGTTQSHLKEERENINLSRINSIKRCKKEFGDRFYGGLQDSPISRKLAPELIISPSVTKRENYLKLIQNHNICIATKGLHNSIGWRFAEYVAASRAIITEPLDYLLPGSFKNKINYLEFVNEDELITNMHLLNKDNELTIKMMNRNYNYYNNYVRSDKLVLNALLNLLT